MKLLTVFLNLNTATGYLKNPTKDNLLYQLSGFIESCAPVLIGILALILIGYIISFVFSKNPVKKTKKQSSMKFLLGTIFFLAISYGFSIVQMPLYLKYITGTILLLTMLIFTAKTKKFGL